MILASTSRGIIHPYIGFILLGNTVQFDGYSTIMPFFGKKKPSSEDLVLAKYNLGKVIGK